MAHLYFDFEDMGNFLLWFYSILFTFPLLFIFFIQFFKVINKKIDFETNQPTFFYKSFNTIKSINLEDIKEVSVNYIIKSDRTEEISLPGYFIPTWVYLGRVKMVIHLKNTESLTIDSLLITNENLQKTTTYLEKNEIQINYKKKYFCF